MIEGLIYLSLSMDGFPGKIFYQGCKASLRKGKLAWILRKELKS